jgi:hypothetical protein
VIVTVEHHVGTSRCLDEEALRVALAIRDANGLNHFWISSDARRPCFSMFVRDDVAVAHYFPDEEDHPGFISQGPGDPEDSVQFSLHGESTWIHRGAIIPFAVAVDAAVEFARTLARPPGVTWFEL